jgi:flap endonuclease-1
MGIRGLKTLLKKNVPEAFTEISYSDLNEKSIAIDSSILLYKYRYVYPDSDDFHLIGIKQEIQKFNNYNIKPIFVFDGTPPEAKQRVLQERALEKNKKKDRITELEKSIPENVDEMIDSDSDDSEIIKIKKINNEIKRLKKNILYVNKKHSLEVIELLKSLGIPFLKSSGEAEQTCAILQKTGQVDYVLTEDTDSLTFGAKKVLFNIKNNLILCDLEIILNKLELTNLEFIDLCILCGCDYTCTIPKLGHAIALKTILKWRSIPIFIENNSTFIIPDTFDYQIARYLFNLNLI